MSEEELANLVNGDVDSMEVDESSKKSSEDSGDFLPPLASDDNRMVDQLDDVTKDSEKKATEMFDSLDLINEFLNIAEENLNGDIKNVMQSNIDVFEKLTKQFPNIQMFQDSLEKNRGLVKIFEKMLDNTYTNQDEIMMIMDKMQYQDIHRQKIERVINVMRSLSVYMNHLFSSSVDDSKRVSSAKHIPGDTNDNLVKEDDIEALIASLGK